METMKISMDFQIKAEKDKLTKKEKELDKFKTERSKWEAKTQAAEDELNVSRKNLLRCYVNQKMISKFSVY